MYILDVHVRTYIGCKHACTYMCVNMHVRTYVHVVEYSTRDMHVHVVEMLWRGPAPMVKYSIETCYSTCKDVCMYMYI